MGGYAPRAREDSVRPRRLSGVVVRPLNFTVRAHMLSFLRLLTIRGASKSLRGHVVFLQAACSVPMFLLFAAWNYQDGTLTPAWAGRIAFASSACGLFMALIGWYFITLPILKRSRRRQ